MSFITRARCAVHRTSQIVRVKYSNSTIIRSNEMSSLPAFAIVHVQTIPQKSYPVLTKRQSNALLSVTNQNSYKVRCYNTAAPTAASRETIEKLVKNNKVVIFMKGVPEQPRCGFSNAVVKILEMHGVNKYDAHDVLADEGIRQGIKDYSQWPTIPQVFINGEFVGGCDILMDMHKSGELVEQLQKVGIKSALLEADQLKTKPTDKK